ncbi:MAG: transketolase [Lachnospiraceae bacterium]|jgi:transketolase|nr:transketolase [Lachnospiraceae bacterium]
MPDNGSENSVKKNGRSREELVRELEKRALEIRKNLLTLCSQQVIHIGGDLSVADVMTVLWQYQIRYDTKNPKDESRDRFILSKGHAAAVTSFNQAAIGCYDNADIFREYAQDNGRFAMHSCNLINPHVEVSTGSLGHGLPVAAGIAQALKLKKNETSRVYVVTGDGEHGEGSLWEAIMNAAHYKLGNLVCIVDCNGLGFDGTLKDITGLGDIADKYRIFGWNVTEVDGHEIDELIDAFDHLPPTSFDKPTALICHTVKGHGVDFMENQVKWHAGRLSEENRDEAIRQLEDAFNRKWGGQ